MFCLAATSSHITYNLGITAAAAAAHPPNTSFEFHEHPRRIQSNSSRTTAAASAAAAQQQRTSHRLIYSGGTPVFCVLPFKLATPSGFGVIYTLKGNLVPGTNCIAINNLPAM